MTTGRKVGTLVTRTAIDSAVRDGRTALPRETGGILMGFRTPVAVVVTRMLTVPDPRSSPHSYLRRRRRAQAQMAATHTETPRVVGYVGEWHTHPEDEEPSRTDLRAIAETARLASDTVALLVLSYPATGPARVYGRVAVRRGSWPIAVMDPVDIIGKCVTITEDTAASLEAEAARALTNTGGPS